MASAPRVDVHRVFGALRRGRSDADLQEELRLHMELAAEDAQRRGEPTRTARLHTGGAAQAMDALRDQRGWPWLHSVSSDLVFAWRQLKKHRTASLAAHSLARSRRRCDDRGVPSAGRGSPAHAPRRRAGQALRARMEFDDVAG